MFLFVTCVDRVSTGVPNAQSIGLNILHCYTGVENVRSTTHPIIAKHLTQTKSYQKTKLLHQIMSVCK